jgi:hypothetical protein
MTQMPQATLGQLVKLASIARHVDEYVSDGVRRPIDLETAAALLQDPDVQKIMADLDALALLPVKR